MEKNNKYLKKCEDQGACFSPLPFESFALAARVVLDLVSSLVKKALILILLFYYLIGKNVFQLLYKYIQQNLFWKHQCQRETPKEDKILWIVLCSKLTTFE